VGRDIHSNIKTSTQVKCVVVVVVVVTVVVVVVVTVIVATAAVFPSQSPDLWL
jgi:hypothetical protein